MFAEEFNISILRDIEEDISFYTDMKLYYVLMGQLQITIEDSTYLLEKDDIFLMNMGIKRGRVKAENALFCQIIIDDSISHKVVDHKTGAFMCNSVTDIEHSYEELRTVLKKLVYQQAACNHKSKSYEISLCFQILDILIDNFMTEEPQMFGVESSVASKLQDIIQYVYQNYQSHISLGDVAEELFVSKSTLSRLFKKETGVYFSEYVNQIRLKRAVSELHNDSINITRIAMNCGFSNSATFNRIFREKYGITPTEYREKLYNQEMNEKREKEIIQHQILEEIHIIEDDEKSRKNIVEEDMESTIYFQKTWNKTINIGSIQKLSMAHIQFQTLELVKELEFTHVRVWNIFSKRLMIWDGENTRHYNYDAIDVIFDFLVTNHISAFLDFGRRPDTALKAEGIELFCEEEYVEFVSRKAWETAVKDLLLHIVERYGKPVIEKWIFELTDMYIESDRKLYKDKNYEFDLVFCSFYGIVKNIVPNAEVGGYSAFAGERSKHFIQFLSNCKKYECVPDFVSLLLFPYERIEEKERSSFFKRNPEKNLEKNMIGTYKSILKKYGLSECKIYITEWNSSLSNRNYLNDSCFRSAYVVKKISEIWNSVDMICFWFGSDWISSYYDSRNIVNGAGGILTKDNIKKPIWYAFRFLNYLGNELIGIGENYILTKRSEMSFAVLCFNFKWFSCDYFFLNENEISLSRIKEMFEDNDTIKLEMCLKHIAQNGEYIIKKRRINSQHGCVLTEWIKMGADDCLERSDIKYIENMCIPYMERSKVRIQENRLDISVEMRDQEIVLIHIFKSEE